MGGVFYENGFFFLKNAGSKMGGKWIDDGKRGTG